MTNVFISYSRDDAELADSIRRGLAEAGIATLMGDDPLQSGAEWRKTLVKKIAKADAVVVVVSKSAVESSWTMTELGIAWGANKKMIGVLAPGEHPEELGVTPLKNIKLLRAAKSDTAELTAQIIKAAEDASYNQKT
jgi:nucleoside 2-deoxyribosyltransferase